MRKKELIYYLIEVAFTLLCGIYLYELLKTDAFINEFSSCFFYATLLIMLFLIWFFGPMFNRFIMFLYLGVISLYVISQEIYFTAFHSHYRFKLAISMYKDMLVFKDSAADFIEFNNFIPFIVLIITAVLFFVIYLKFQRNTISFKHNLVIRFVSVLLLTPLYGINNNFHKLLDDSAIDKGFTLNETEKYIYTYIPDADSFIKKFGILSFGWRDFNSLFENKSYSLEDYEEITEFLNNIKEQTNNEYTGIFKGKNVLFIEAESFNDFACDPELTPFIYMLKTQGINVENFDAPATQGSTSDSDFAANLSLIPDSSEGNCCYTYPYNTYKTTLAGLFKDAGYNTIAFHNLFGSYYNRSTIYSQIGYDRFFDCTDFGNNDLLSDSFCATNIAWILASDSPTMCYWITYSGHQPYDLNSVGVNEEDVVRIKNKYPDLDDEYVSYFAKNMDLDHALEEIILTLDMLGKTDNYVLYFFGDHVVKFLDTSENSPLYTKTSKEYNPINDNTDLFIYSNGIEPVKYEKVGTLIDLLPTVANMFDLPYDSRTILGRDLFDVTYSGFKYGVWNYWETDNYIYNQFDDEYTINNDFDLNKAKEEITYFKNMKEISTKIIKMDYFAKGE